MAVCLENAHPRQFLRRRETAHAGKRSYPAYRCTPEIGTCGKKFISPHCLHPGERHLRENAHFPRIAPPRERHLREKVHFPHITAPEKSHARIWGKCTPACSETGEMGGKPHAARAEKRSFPQHRCTRFLRCNDMGEMHGKGLEVTSFLLQLRWHAKAVTDELTKYAARG